MNTNPTEEALALWVEDELHGAEAVVVDAWAAGHPEWLAHREDARKVKALLKAALPAAEEPPYPDFFNTKIARSISAARPAAVAPKVRPMEWFRWFMPAAAAAGMAICFWAGMKVNSSPSDGTGMAGVVPVVSVPEPFLYVPEKGVKAAYYASSVADAGVIVLDGVAAIPDSFEVPETAAIREEAPATAGNDEFR